MLTVYIYNFLNKKFDKNIEHDTITITRRLISFNFISFNFNTKHKIYDTTKRVNTRN